MDKSNETIAGQIKNKVELMINSMLPMPTCPRAKARIEWRRDEVRKMLVDKLKQPNNNDI